ncbi:hypothetical protein FRB96_001585 [Tulasnella sp. 330]|nr:hypothetical protein FRB96_001585 [Tulasnella sp. 330]
MRVHSRTLSPLTQPYILRPTTFATSYVRASSYESEDSSSTDCDGRPLGHALDYQMTEDRSGPAISYQPNPEIVDSSTILQASAEGERCDSPIIPTASAISTDFSPPNPSTCAGGPVLSTARTSEGFNDFLGPPTSFPYFPQASPSEEILATPAATTCGTGAKRVMNKDKAPRQLARDPYVSAAESARSRKAWTASHKLAVVATMFQLHVFTLQDAKARASEIHDKLVKNDSRWCKGR